MTAAAMSRPTSSPRKGNVAPRMIGDEIIDVAQPPSAVWVGSSTAEGGCATKPLRERAEILVDEGDSHRALADGGGDALDGVGADVARGEHAGSAGLEHERLAAQRPAR